MEMDKQNWYLLSMIIIGTCAVIAARVATVIDGKPPVLSLAVNVALVISWIVMVWMGFALGAVMHYNTEKKTKENKIPEPE